MMKHSYPRPFGSRRILSLFVTALLMLVLSACSSPGDEFVGRWVEADVTHPGYFEIFTPNSDGVILARSWSGAKDDSPAQIEFVLDEDASVLRVDNFNASFVIEEGVLVWYETGKSEPLHEFVRAEDWPFPPTSSD